MEYFALLEAPHIEFLDIHMSSPHWITMLYLDGHRLARSGEDLTRVRECKLELG